RCCANTTARSDPRHPAVSQRKPRIAGSGSWPSCVQRPRLSRLTNGCAWDAVSAFANCGRAVAYVRGSYVPISDNQPPEKVEDTDVSFVCYTIGRVLASVRRGQRVFCQRVPTLVIR